MQWEGYDILKNKFFLSPMFGHHPRIFHIKKKYVNYKIRNYEFSLE